MSKPPSKWQDETFFVSYDFTDLTYILPYFDFKLNFLKLSIFVCYLICASSMVNLFQPVLWWTVDSTTLRNIWKNKKRNTIHFGSIAIIFDCQIKVIHQKAWFNLYWESIILSDGCNYNFFRISEFSSHPNPSQTIYPWYIRQYHYFIIFRSKTFFAWLIDWSTSNM